MQHTRRGTDATTGQEWQDRRRHEIMGLALQDHRHDVRTVKWWIVRNLASFVVVAVLLANCFMLVMIPGAAWADVVIFRRWIIANLAALVAAIMVAADQLVHA